jgi:hypothetical protein
MATEGRATIRIDQTPKGTPNTKSSGFPNAARTSPDLAAHHRLRRHNFTSSQTLSNANGDTHNRSITHAYPYTNTHSYGYADTHSYLDSYSNHGATGSVAEP